MPTERLVMRRVREHPECRKKVQPDEACLSRNCNSATSATTPARGQAVLSSRLADKAIVSLNADFSAYLSCGDHTDHHRLCHSNRVQAIDWYEP
jgi:hypothetical protein